MKSRKVQEIPKAQREKGGMEAEKCRKYPAQRKKGYGGQKDRKYPGRSGKKGYRGRKVQKIPGAQREKKGIEAEKCRKYPGAAAGRVWRPKRMGNTQGTPETRRWDTKNKYSTQTKKKEYEKMSVARYIHFGKNKTIVQNGV